MEHEQDVVKVRIAGMNWSEAHEMVRVVENGYSQYQNRIGLSSDQLIRKCNLQEEIKRLEGRGSKQH